MIETTRATNHDHLIKNTIAVFVSMKFVATFTISLPGPGRSFEIELVKIPDNITGGTTGALYPIDCANAVWTYNGLESFVSPR